MATVPEQHRACNDNPAAWPAWTDQDIWEPTDPAEWPEWTLERWETVEPGPDCDERAIESAALDRLELGLIPPDLADLLAATSLVGPADAILHAGSDPRFCPCEDCTLDRTDRYI